MKRFDKPSYGQKSYHSSLSGVVNVINRFYRELLSDNLDKKQLLKEVNNIMQEYLLENFLEFKSGHSLKDTKFNANMVQERFSRFKAFCKKKCKNIKQEEKMKKQFEEELNDMTYQEEQDFILGGKMRTYYYHRQMYGTALRKHDPIAFQVAYNEWKLKK